MHHQKNLVFGNKEIKKFTQPKKKVKKSYFSSSLDFSLLISSSSFPSSLKKKR
jgi:hypothetical protein